MHASYILSESIKAGMYARGDSQVVRLPKEFRPDATEVLIFRRGDEIVLRELSRDLTGAFEILCALPDDVLTDRHDDVPQTREEQ